MRTDAVDQARVDFRAPREAKALIEQAAAVLGLTVSDFAKATLLERSRQVIEANETRVLSNRDRDLFLALIEAPPAPNAALQAAAADYRTAVQRGEITVR